MPTIHERAYAKVNLCLLLGGTRDDGRHELVTLFESVTLADDLVIESPSPSGADAVICPGLDGPNLVAEAITTLRAAGWGAPAVQVEIEKRIPIAAGLGGGSADAAALLRAAPRLADVGPATISEIAARLGADVPSQLDPGLALGTGAGEIVRPLAALAEHALLVLPHSAGLSTADVYRQADALGLARSQTALDALRAELEFSLVAEAQLPDDLLANDLQPASLSLVPQIAGALTAAVDAGCEHAIVCGSGPTVIGVCWGTDSLERIGRARERVVSRFPSAVTVEPVTRAQPV
jgi:4-diphosphocytidyl-2-C-methyl-D-erythritol kinase